MESCRRILGLFVGRVETMDSSIEVYECAFNKDYLCSKTLECLKAKKPLCMELKGLPAEKLGLVLHVEIKRSGRRTYVNLPDTEVKVCRMKSGDILTIQIIDIVRKDEEKRG